MRGQILQYLLDSDKKIKGAVLIGSRSINVHAEKSDWDFCVDIEMWDKITYDVEVEYGGSGQDTNIMRNIDSCKFTENGEVINLILFDEYGMTNQRRINAIMKNLQDAVSYKNVRHQINEAITDLIYDGRPIRGEGHNSALRSLTIQDDDEVPF